MLCTLLKNSCLCQVGKDVLLKFAWVPCSPKPMSKTIATGLSKSPASGEMPFFTEGKGVSHDWTRVSYNPSSREQN